MWFRVDPASGVGLADQIAGQVRAALAEGRVGPGDRLPPAREVATGLKVNMHTVLRAYAALRDDGILEMRRGRGARIRPDADPNSVALHLQVRALLDLARRYGLTSEQLITEIRKVGT